MTAATVRFRRLAHGEGLALPARASAGSAGIDLAAAVESEVVVAPGGRALVPTGFAVAIPPGHEGQVRPRSGLAWKHGVTLLNTPGTIDSDYRGELSVILVNLGAEPFSIHRGDRIAQLIVARVESVEIVEAPALDGTERGAGGFGSTGRR